MEIVAQTNDIKTGKEKKVCKKADYNDLSLPRLSEISAERASGSKLEPQPRAVSGGGLLCWW